MDVDAALNELGMLSAVTNSRRDYQCELQRNDGDSSLACFHVVTANPKFVVNIGAVQQNYPSKPKREASTGCRKVVPSTILEPTKLDESSAERRTLKASSRMHHRYFFRPYSKHRRTKRVSLVKDLRTRSLDGGFQIRLPPPAESTLTQAMASMKIERPKNGTSAAADVATLPVPPCRCETKEGITGSCKVAAIERWLNTCRGGTSGLKMKLPRLL